MRLNSPITIFYAPPRSGKTYLAVRTILDSLKDGRQVVSNIPVDIPGVYRFDERILSGAPVYDSDIIIDEAYRYFSSRNFAKFSMSQHEFFSLCGHYGNRIVLIAQHPARLDKIIREDCGEFIFAHCVRIPFSTRPLLFRYSTFDFDPSLVGSLSETQHMKPTSSKLVFFRKKYARLYDTHQLRPSDPPLELRLWVESEAEPEP